MLSHEETLSLIKKAKEEDAEAMEQLVRLNSPLVKSIVKRYLRKNVDYEDLFQLGSMGLVKAIKNFDSSFGVRFSTYAVPMIAGEIKRFLRDDGSIKVSRSTKMLYSDIKNFIEEYKAVNEDSPKVETIAKHFDLEVEEIIFAMQASSMPVSIYKKLDGAKGERTQTVFEKITDGDKTEELITSLALKKMLGELSLKEQKIVLLRFYRGKTQSEVAELLNVSQVQVSRLETKILNDLRRKLIEEVN
ncbi:MAG: sigma-70 family RNA polymerase sigma factor [Firmicutes bacterium]|jgi:RNA polymerase sporulation-specific sigma factor|nr:sigma-70 family RNA polymerase sigma factor [Bacillota bacterium]